MNSDEIVVESFRGISLLVAQVDQRIARISQRHHEINIGQIGIISLFLSHCCIQIEHYGDYSIL